MAQTVNTRQEGHELRDAVGEAVLAAALRDCAEGLDGVLAAFENSGELAVEFEVAEGSMCGLCHAPGREDLAARCRQVTWAAARDSIEGGAARDVVCPLGERLIHAEPIRAGEKEVGALTFSYGDPPRDPRALQRVAERMRIPLPVLRQAVVATVSPLDVFIAAAKRHARAVAALAGELVLRRRTEQDRVRLENLLLGMVGHDLRNPLAAITLSARVLAKPGRTDAQLAQAASTVERASRRMGRLIEETLDYVRLRGGQPLRVELRLVAAPAMIERAVEEFHAAHPDAVVEWATDERSAACDVSCDADRLVELLLNLLDNALKYGRHGAPIRMAVGRRDGRICIAVGNTGKPIPPEDQAVIFEPLRQGRAGQMERGGLGLGLYIAREIARANGGELRLDSTASETVFTVDLPAAA